MASKSPKPKGDIDPGAINIPAQRKRRARHKPDPSPQLAAGKAAALKRAKCRPLSPGLIYEHDGEGYVVQSPHSDPELWELQIGDAFGTRSLSVMKTFVAQLKALVGRDWDAANEAWKPNETELNALLAMVADFRPSSVAQAALAAQLAAVHLMTMRLSSQALNRGGMIMEKDAALAGKLARTFAIQLETMQALKGKRRTARQSIKVSKETHLHQHIHVTRGAEKNGATTHDKATDSTAQCPALLSDQSGGEVVRLPSRARKAGLP